MMERMRAEHGSSDKEYKSGNNRTARPCFFGIGFLRPRPASMSPMCGAVTLFVTFQSRPLWGTVPVPFGCPSCAHVHF